MGIHGLADQHTVVAHVHGPDDPAVDHGEHAFDPGRSGHAGAPRDSGEAAFGKFGETLGKIGLSFAQNIYGEQTGIEMFEDRASMRDGDHHQRRIE